MSFSAVCSARRISMLSNVNADSILWKFVVLQRATYLNRYQSIIRSYGGNQKIAKIGMENPSCLQTSIAVASEISVMLDYMRSSCLHQIVGFTDDEFLEFSKALFFPWICFQIVLHTLKNGGNKQKVVYCIDESYLKLQGDIVLNFVKTSPDIIDPLYVANFTHEYFDKTLDVTNKFHNARFEDALQLASRIFPHNEGLKLQLNDMFKELRRQYDDNFDDCALRLANIILILGDIEELVTIYNHYITILELHGYKTVFSQKYGTSVLLANRINSIPEIIY